MTTLAYWLEPRPGPVGALWPLYAALALAFAALAVPAVSRASGRHPARGPARAQLALSAAGLALIAARFAGLPVLSMRALVPALLLAAGALPVLAPVWRGLLERLAAALAFAVEPAGEALPARATLALAAVYGAVLVVAGHLQGQPLWYAPAVLALLLAPQVAAWRRLGTLRLEALAPLLWVGVLIGLRVLSALLVRAGLVATQTCAPTGAGCFGVYFDVPAAMRFSAAYAALITGLLVLRAYRRAAWAPLVAAGVLALALAGWAGAAYLTRFTSGATGTDPFAYTLMGVDIARTGLPLHAFPLVSVADELGLPWEPAVHLGYRLPIDASGRAPTVWPPGHSVLLALGYLVAGEVGLYAVTPLVALLAALAAGALAWTLYPASLPRSLRALAAVLAAGLVATSPEQILRALVPMADASAALFTVLALLLAWRATGGGRGAGANGQRRGDPPLAPQKARGSQGAGRRSPVRLLAAGRPTGRAGASRSAGGPAPGMQASPAPTTGDDLGGGRAGPANAPPEASAPEGVAGARTLRLLAAGRAGASPAPTVPAGTIPPPAFSGRPWTAIAAGLCLGLAYDMRYTQVLIALSFLLLGLGLPGWRARLRFYVPAGLAALAAALPDLWYHQIAFGGALQTGSDELRHFALANVWPMAQALWAELSLPGEITWPWLWILAGVGAVTLWRTYRLRLLALVSGPLLVIAFHLFYGYLRMRDLLPQYPLAAALVAVGTVAILAWMARVMVSRSNVVRGLAVASALAVLALIFAARTEPALGMPFSPGFSTFGYLLPAQRAAFERLAARTAPGAVVAATLNSGAVELYGGRQAFRPGDWDVPQATRFVEALLARGRPVYLLADGVALEPLRADLLARGRLVERDRLPLPYFYPGGGSLNQDVILYQVEPHG